MARFFYFLHPVIVALLAGSLEAISYSWSMLVSWTAFASWACYFIFVTKSEAKKV